MLFKKIVPFSIFFLLVLFSNSLPAQNQSNIIVILSDDAGYNDFECYGGKEIPTPNINRLASEGAKFTNAYVTASVCAPSRAGLLTGRYQQRFGFEHNMSGALAKGFTQDDLGMELHQKTIGDYLQSAGYRTLAIGKWHLGSSAAYFPLNRGFDEFYGFKEGHREFFHYTKLPNDNYALYDNNHIVPEKQVTYTTDMFTDRALSFIQENKSRPFFIYLAYNAVHTPLEAKPSDLARFPNSMENNRKTYAAMMANMDDGIGRIMDALKANQIDNNTLVFFLNDNGGATNNGSDNGPLRGMKGSKWEGGIRVAFIMRWPGQIQAGTVYNKAVSALDIVPTAAAISGFEIPRYKTDGVNLLPYLSNPKKAPHQDLFWRRGIAAAVRSGNWKLIRVPSNPILLFDLKKDSTEKLNLANKHPKLVKKLLARLENWEKGLEAPRWYSSAPDSFQVLKHRMNVIGRDMERKYP